MVESILYSFLCLSPHSVYLLFFRILGSNRAEANYWDWVGERNKVETEI